MFLISLYEISEKARNSLTFHYFTRYTRFIEEFKYFSLILAKSS